MKNPVVESGEHDARRQSIFGDVTRIIDAARQSAARSVNAVLTNYPREHWVHEGENPPVGLVLCDQKDQTIVRYALEGLANKVLAAENRPTLPDETLLASEIDRAREALNTRGLLSNNAMSSSHDQTISGKPR